MYQTGERVIPSGKHAWFSNENWQDGWVTANGQRRELKRIRRLTKYLQQFKESERRILGRLTPFQTVWVRQTDLDLTIPNEMPQNERVQDSVSHAAMTLLGNRP